MEQLQIQTNQIQTYFVKQYIYPLNVFNFFSEKLKHISKFDQVNCLILYNKDRDTKEFKNILNLQYYFSKSNLFVFVYTPLQLNHFLTYLHYQYMSLDDDQEDIFENSMAKLQEMEKTQQSLQDFFEIEDDLKKFYMQTPNFNFLIPQYILCLYQYIPGQENEKQSKILELLDNYTIGLKEKGCNYLIQDIIERISKILIQILNDPDFVLISNFKYRKSFVKKIQVLQNGQNNIIKNFLMNKAVTQDERNIKEKLVEYYVVNKLIILKILNNLGSEGETDNQQMLQKFLHFDNANFTKTVQDQNLREGQKANEKKERSN